MLGLVISVLAFTTIAVGTQDSTITPGEFSFPFITSTAGVGMTMLVGTPGLVSSASGETPTCLTDCRGLVYVSLFLTGTQISVDTASTTGPPNCRLQDKDLGAGYILNQTTSILYKYIEMDYGLQDGVVSDGNEVLVNMPVTSIGTNLARFNNITIACLASGDSVINSYSSIGTGRECFPIIKNIALASSIVLQNESISFVVSSATYLVNSLRSQLATTTCNTAMIFDTGCYTVKSTSLLVQGVWIGVPLTYDVFQITTPPDCARPIEFLGSGYTGSGTYTTVIYDAGSIDLGTGEAIGQQAFGGPPIENGLITIDEQTIGCLISLHYLAQTYYILESYNFCPISSFVEQAVTFKKPVTATGPEPFLTTENGRVSLIPQIRNQIATISNPAAMIPSTAMTISAGLPHPSSVLTALDDSNPELSQRTKIILLISVSLAIILALAFVSFFIWQRSCLYKQNCVTVPQMSISKPIFLQRQASWRAPLIMFAGLISGLTFALGHHFFYNWIAQQRVDDINISQSWIFRLGNLFAFAFKLSLSIGVGTAFVQLQWTNLRRYSLRMKDIDTLSGVLSNVLSFGEGLIWLRYPGLSLIATIYWSLSIIPVITPGSITVVSRAYQDLTYLKVPQLNVNYSTWVEGGIDNPSWGAPALHSIAMASASLGEILPIRFNYTNATYHLEFNGPAIQCYNADIAKTLNISDTLAITLKHGEMGGYNNSYYSYYSWVASENIWNPDTIHCGNDRNNLDTASPDRARLYIMTNGGTGWYGNHTAGNLTECSLYNATYNVDFQFNNTQQTVITHINYLHGVPLTWDIDQMYSDAENVERVGAYGSLMSTFGSLLVGSIASAADTTLSQACTSVRYTNIGLSFDSLFPPETAWYAVPPLENLQSCIEEVFQNITISLLSNDLFIKDPSIADLVPVNITTVLNTYSYNSFDLVLTYTVGLLFTLVCCLIGFYTFYLNEGSYRNVYSTFIRATRRSELDIEDEDTGADPCPRILSQVLVTFTPNIPNSIEPTSNPTKQHLIPRKPVPVRQGSYIAETANQVQDRNSVLVEEDR